MPVAEASIKRALLHPLARPPSRPVMGCFLQLGRKLGRKSGGGFGVTMGHYLLIGAGFSRNWGGPLSEDITGSLLGELHDDVVIANALRRVPFEEAFGGFQSPAAGNPAGA